MPGIKTGEFLTTTKTVFFFRYFRTRLSDLPQKRSKRHIQMRFDWLFDVNTLANQLSQQISSARTLFLINVFFFLKLLVVVFGPASFEELVSVEDEPSARFARYGFKINNLTCLRF